MNIYLIKPTKEYEEQVMKIREEFLNNNEGFDECSGLENYTTYDEWLDFEDRLKKAYKETYVPASVYLGVRKEDNKVVGIIDLRHYLNEFLHTYGGNFQKFLTFQSIFSFFPN